MIKEHYLQTATHFASPHCDARPEAEAISLLVIHCISLPEGCYGTPYVKDLFLGNLDTSEGSGFEPLAGLTVSAHLVIRRNGQVEQYVPFNQRAWHAGQSSYCGRRRCNDFSIGIELEGTDKQPYTAVQYQQLVTITELLLAHYPALSRDRIVGHQHIAPGRKTDPGMAFDWSHYLTQLQTNNT
ncbi:MAG: 1,6-anhydro-N-acetylmuramyl-L-alanine amidase AmpD [Pseudomonadota bacterium]